MAKVQSNFYRLWTGVRIDDTVSTNTVLDAEKEYITVNASGGAVQITLPDTSVSTITSGKKIWIMDNGSAATNNITIIPNALDSTTIDGKSSVVLAKNNGILIFEFVIDKWVVLSDGGLGTKTVKTVTANYTATTADDVILVDASSNAVTVTLYTSSGNAGKELTLTRIDTSANIVTIDGNGSENIQRALTQTLVTDESYSLVADGSNWYLNG